MQTAIANKLNFVNCTCVFLTVYFFSKNTFFTFEHETRWLIRMDIFCSEWTEGDFNQWREREGLAITLASHFLSLPIPPLLLSSSSMQGSGQSVAFDYQSPAAPLLAPWHEHHIRRSDLHRNVSVSIVVSKFTIYRHSRRSPVSETLLCWSSRLSAFIFGSLLLLAYSISCWCFSSSFLSFLFVSPFLLLERGETIHGLFIRRRGFFFRCWARWWGLFKNIDVKIQLFSFSSPPIRRRRECKGARGRKEKGIYLRSTLDRVSFQQKVFLLVPASMWIAPAFPLWLFYIKLQFITSGLGFSYKIRDSWMADCNIPWNWPPDTCISWSGAYSIALLYFECIDRVLLPFLPHMRLRAPIWLCTAPSFEISFFPPLSFINTGDHFAL